MMIPKILIRTFVDTVYLQCDKDLKNDFIKLTNDLNSFNKSFNAKQYINENENTFFFSPEKWIEDFHTVVDEFIKNTIINAHQIAIDRKYLLFSLYDKDKFYTLYKKHYDDTFDKIDDFLHKEQRFMNVFVATKMKEFQEEGMH